MRVVRHGSTVALFGSSTGSFTVNPTHGPGSIPSEFWKGRYSEKYVMFFIAPSNEFHYHSVALLKFSNKLAGSVCFLLNGPANVTSNTVTVSYSVLGGTGDGARLRLSGRGTANVNSSPVSLTAHGRATFGASQSLPAKCRHA